MKVKVVLVTAGPVTLSIVPSLDSRASTISKGISDSIIAELSSTAQVTAIVDISLTGLGGLLVTDTDTGGGTE